MKARWMLAAGAALALAGPAAAQVAPYPMAAQEDPVKQGVDAWTRGDYAGAVAKWRDAAVAGNADAQFNLGQAYKLGRGVPADLAQAEQWYRKAALQGHPQAEDNYGLALFQSGRQAEALPWLQRSAARAEPRAQFVLGTMLFNGDVVGRDWVRAYALLTRASQAGLPQASSALAQMDRYVSLDERSRGITLAREMEEGGDKGTVLASLPPAAPEPAIAPAPAAKPPIVMTYPPAPKPVPVPPRVTPKPAAVAAKPAPRPASKPAVRDGGWRIQLGAFAESGNAQRMWASVRGRFADRQPYYEKAGKVTRLLVGPYASRAEANGACAKVNPCFAVAR